MTTPADQTPITTDQTAFLFYLRDALARASDWTFRVDSPIGGLPRLCRQISARIPDFGPKRAAEVSRAPWLSGVLTDQDTTPEAVAARMHELRRRVATLGADDIAALSKAEASTLISAARALA